MTSTPATSSPAPDRSLHLQCACTLLVAVGAAYASYRHGREFALRFGADETTATIHSPTSFRQSETPWRCWP